MIKLEKTEICGIDSAIRGMRNPLNSWDNSDSGMKMINSDSDSIYEMECKYVVGSKDLGLMKRLVKAGTDHRKFMRMITVYVDITAPLYWWKEFDTYKVGTVVNSCSTMHKIHAKEFTLDDFSHEHLDDFSTETLINVIKTLNIVRDDYNENNTSRYEMLGTTRKDDWWQMIQLLPSSYNQKRTVMLNYEVLANMYKSRKNHKLDEWRELCKWIETLPDSELITGEFKDE